MFYQETADNLLRFGDVLKGYIATSLRMENPEDSTKFNIEINLPDFCVILSPCCSIRDKVILIAPLKPIINTFYKNPYFEDDLTRINRIMDPEQAVPPNKWETIEELEKQRRIASGKTYTFLDYFIYNEHELLPEYILHTQAGQFKTKYYMIDFRDSHKIKCDKFISPENSPISTKLLQLTVQTRKELREKISFYFGNPTSVDIPFLNN